MDDKILKELENFERVWARLSSSQAAEQENREKEPRLMPSKGKKPRPVRYAPYDL